LNPVTGEPSAGLQEAPNDSAADQPASRTEASSPYHPLPTNPVARIGKVQASQIEQIRYSSQPDKDELVPEPPPLSAAPKPVRPPEIRQLTNMGGPEIKPRPVPDPTLVSAVRCYLDKRPADAVLWLDQFDKSNRELLLCLLPIVTRLGEGSLGQADPREIAVLLAQLDRVAAMLRPRAELVVSKLCFCRRIKDSFGVYEPWEENHPFRRGDQIELYVELRNFFAQQVGSFYRIHLASRVEIRDYQGTLVKDYGFRDRDYPDLSRSLRYDFHNRFSFTVPNIPRGDYTLWFYVTDVPTGRVAKRSLDFRIVN
jgi:hypothetical protein